MYNETKSSFLTISEAAQFLCLKKRTLDNLRWTGTGPQFRKHGGRICYHLDELKEWSLKNRRWSTSDY